MSLPLHLIPSNQGSNELPRTSQFPQKRIKLKKAAYILTLLSFVIPFIIGLFWAYQSLMDQGAESKVDLAIGIIFLFWSNYNLRESIESLD